jgi:cytoskeletal protein CcmA (bactofilin family)
MFSNNPKQVVGKPMKKNLTTRETAVTILTSGCHFNGKLYCRGSSRIGGKIEGEIISEGLLIIEEGATILAEVKAEEAIIQGFVRGKIEAKGRVELCNTSRFEGDISSPTLIVHEGAQFNGRSKVIAAQKVEGGRVADSVTDINVKSDRYDSDKTTDIAARANTPELVIS